MSSACSLELWCWQNGASAAVVFPVSSGPHPGAFLSGRAWWAHWVVDGTFHCQKPPRWHILPHHPRQWGSSGVPPGKKKSPSGGAIGCDAIMSKYVHQPTTVQMHTSIDKVVYTHVTTRPPPPGLESEASEVALGHSHSGPAQPYSQWAVMSCAPRGMKTPSQDGPADLEVFRSRSGRPVFLFWDLPLPVVLLPDRGNTRHGRTGTQLAVGNVPSNLFLAEQNFSLFGGHFGHLSKNIIYTIPVQRACRNVCHF